MRCVKRDPRECFTAKQKAPPRAERGEAKLIRFWGLVPRRTVSILANRAYMRLTSQVLPIPAVAAPLRFPTQKQKRPRHAEGACRGRLPLGCSGGPELEGSAT
jgi:hypothetical protein